ncbi:alpha-glucan family phosphorylase [Labedella phragmitis]|uniref:glycogen phosphorylase n=1 Tax=Labedella phragmitis TaxID=2498849 RepID=A0A3S4A5H2_9MICO|nr:alpha-glucan family phosphorylase [Labedella phragmitis]RWZ51941.1 alpha-glucan family phosphorylase [Labedella phragmitis]
MKAIRRFAVRPALPERLAALETLVGNLRWVWHEPTRELFSEIAPGAWEHAQRDPTALFASVSQSRLDELAADDGFVDRAHALRDDLERYLAEPRWYQHLEGDKPESIAYFSPEYGITAALPQYSGGLGILAGDHLKSASDLGVPLVAVGLFYRSGYFSQSLSADGWQQETYPIVDPDGLPLSVLRHLDGTPVDVVLALPDGRSLNSRVWTAKVGRVTLLLLDTDVPENDADLCQVTDRLYGGGEEHRLRQELLLGIGGVRAIKQWCELTGSAFPAVFHTNEGHAGFLGLERISDLVGAGLSFAEAHEVVRGGAVFTTHTPVPAGIDRFDPALVRRYFSTDLLPGVDADDVLSLGQEVDASGVVGPFNMAIMGFRLAQRANGVSRLHGEVSRRMFRSLWPGFDENDVPIGSITNGVHAATWTSPHLAELAERAWGTRDTTAVDWRDDAVSDGALWETKRRLRAELVADARRRVEATWVSQNPGGVVPDWIGSVLDPDILTIGFARRVPTYKRLTLMLHDEERLRALLLDPERPIQIVVAGKSHPADEEGKRLIQQLVEFTAHPDVRSRIVFLPDYDMAMAKTLFPGTDVWLNNPLRPLEACGTSGMKAALNGSLNLSILDGWWNEFHDGANGWGIPTAAANVPPEERDRIEASSLYELLEHHIVPRFYDRDDAGIPRSWMTSVRHSLATLSPTLSADRMLRQYVEALYVPAARAAARLSESGYRPARELAAWKQRVVSAWPNVAITHVESGGLDVTPQVGEMLRLRAYVDLGALRSEDVSVELVYGSGSAEGELTDASILPLEPVDPGVSAGRGTDDGGTVYGGELRLERSGNFGYTVRVVPHHADVASDVEMGLVAVAQ